MTTTLHQLQTRTPSDKATTTAHAYIVQWHHRGASVDAWDDEALAEVDTCGPTEEEARARVEDAFDVPGLRPDHGTDARAYPTRAAATAREGPRPRRAGPDRARGDREGERDPRGGVRRAGGGRGDRGGPGSGPGCPGAGVGRARRDRVDRRSSRGGVTPWQLTNAGISCRAAWRYRPESPCGSNGSRWRRNDRAP